MISQYFKFMQRLAGTLVIGNRHRPQALLSIAMPFRYLLLSAALAFVSAGSFAQSVNPLETDPRAAQSGGTLFRANCATCHGADGKGIQDINAPDLSTLWTVGGRTDEVVFQTIRNGISGSIMPPHTLPDTEIWMMVSFLKSLGNVASATAFSGDAERGAAVFAANCAECHQVNGAGGSLGPNLTNITATRSRDALISSIRNPSALFVSGYKPVSLLTKDNQRLDGTLKSEDAFSIQIMDTTQRLRGYRKADLQELLRPETSLMPQFGTSNLSETELEDVLSFLQSQRTVRPN